MAFTGMVLTNQGLTLQAKVVAGATLAFTRMKLGNGALGTGQSLNTLTDLISPQLIVSLSGVTQSSGSCTVAGTVSNAGVVTGFMVNEIGVYATDPTAGVGGTPMEILYAVANAGGQCDYLPPGGGAIVVEEALNVVLSVSNGTTITATVNTALYATLAQLALYLPLAGGSMAGAINEFMGASIASASTTNIGAATGNFVQVTGTTAITSLGTVQAGTRRIVEFMGALTLTYNATSLILPGAGNIATATGDIAEFVSLGSGNWICVGYQRASGQPMGTVPIAYGGTGAVTAPAALAALGALGLAGGSMTGVIAMGSNKITGLAAGVVATDAANISQVLDFSSFAQFKAQVTSNTAASISAANNPFSGSGTISLTLNTGTTGANGLDTGTLAASQWYNLFICYGTSGVCSLMSLSATAPTLPAGYTALAIRVGAVREDSNKYLMRTLQTGRNGRYVVTAASNTAALPLMASGTQGTYSPTAPTWAPLAVSQYVPPSAASITFTAFNSYNGGGPATVIAAPNNSYSGPQSSTGNTPQIYISTTGSTAVTSALELESTNIYIASSTTGAAWACYGWEDNL